MLVTTRGQAAVIHRSGFDLYAATWDGSAWGEHAIDSQGFGQVLGTVSQIEGRVTLLTQGQYTGMCCYVGLWSWTQQDSGEFAPPVLITQQRGSVPALTRSRYTASDGVLAAAGNQYSFLLISAQHVDGGGWELTGIQSLRPIPSTIDAAGVGRLADGTAIIVSFGSDGLWLYRRVDAWAPFRSLADGNIPYANVEFPPETAHEAAAALAVYTDAATRLPRGMLFGLADGSPIHDAELLPSAIASLDAQIAYAPDGLSGEILLWDRDQHLAYLAGFDTASFQPATALRPDLVFDAIPRLVYYPGAGYLILQVSRPPDEAPGSHPALLQPLGEFAR